MLAAKLLAGGGTDTLYVDDVFSAYTYTGNGSTQTITNGIDLAGKGGLVWIKSRSAVSGNLLSDTAQGTTKFLVSNTTGAQQTDAGGVTAFNSNGFALGSSTGFNGNTSTQVAWTFRKAPKFFDVVTFTATASTNQRISHSLGQSPGMIIAKRTDNTSQWEVYHRSIGRDSYIWLNDTGAAGSYAGRWGASDPTSTDFGINGTSVFGAGTSWVAYLFAHDTGTDGLIQCGSFTTDGSGNATVTLGWEPQYILRKRTDSTSQWTVEDTARGSSQTGVKWIYANTSDAELDGGGWCKPTATGFTAYSMGASVPFIYLAIRRPNKPPTTGTQVYNAIARTGTGAAATVTGVGFAPDLSLSANRDGYFGAGYLAVSRLQGAPLALKLNATDAEVSDTLGLTAFTMNGVTVGTDATRGSINAGGGTKQVTHFFKRAPGVFDVVCYTGTGSARTVGHGLGAVPELMIVKNRGAVSNWSVYTAASGNSNAQYLNLTNAAGASSGWNSTTPTASVFSLASNAADYNQSANTYVAYLFATLAGVSKCGSYTGNGSSQTINCGFTTGARFILIKRTDSTGDWFVWDTTRGIIAGNDPYLLLNSTAAEVTSTDYIDPSTSGFELSSTAPAAINASGGTFIYLAFA